MTGTNETPSLLRFHCNSCQAELTVPATLAGIEGPCPACFQTIRAPIPEAVYSRPLTPPVGLALEPLPPEFEALTAPPERQRAIQPIPLPQRTSGLNPGLNSGFAQPLLDKSFKAKLAIPPGEEPLDDTWKDRHREQNRQTRRVRKVEKAAESLLNSRSFAFIRVAMILVSAAMLVWLFAYMKDHQWRLPGMSPPPLAKEKTGGSGTVRSTGGDANQLVADEDIELPPAADEKPAPPAGNTPAVAAPGP